MSRAATERWQRGERDKNQPLQAPSSSDREEAKEHHATDDWLRHTRLATAQDKRRSKATILNGTSHTLPPKALTFVHLKQGESLSG